MTRLTVAIRVRPLSDRESAAKSVSIVSVENGKTVAVTNIKVPEQNAGDSRERIRRFNFDYCFNCKSTQEDVYWRIGKEIVKAIQKRFHSCILAYGQSASGKTHTMIGADGDDGVVPRLCQNVFHYLNESAIGSELENVNVTVSYLEIYNEKVRDLLHPDADAKRIQTRNVLKVREHPKTGPYVQGLSEQTVSNSNALISLLEAGNANRTIGATNANPRSSRSHSVFTITCFGGLKLRFVDLAGSERAGSHTTSRFREGSNINKSLVALRNVISALADWSKLPRSKKRFVPYRDSVLTWLLKDTLGGNSKTILISTVSPSSASYNETVNTLRFGQRAKQIAVEPLFNEDPKERTIRELRAEIAKLRELIEHIEKPTSLSTLQEQHCNTAAAVHQHDEVSSDSDSGVSENNHNSNVSDDCEDATTSTSVLIKTVVKEDDASKRVSVDKLIPLMHVTSEMAEKSKSRSLRRTFSIDQRGEPQQQEQPSSVYSSHEVLSNNVETSKKTVPAVSLRKTSMDKSNTSLKKVDAKPKIEPKPKVDSHRRAQPKPRSQIVAAVTQRLYNKVKKKEVGTDTLDLGNPMRDLSITSQARLRLQELTHKALKAHRRKNAETQTNLFPVLRFKEMATDSDDLKLLTDQVANVEAATDAIAFADAATNCTMLESFQADENQQEIAKPCALVLTRSCGTSTEYLADKPMSFRKYLLPQQQAPTFEIVNPATANPIYTSSVNINVNHNYHTGPISNNQHQHQQVNDNLSDDSLEESQCQTNVCFPTPDLISNHNSLEAHAQPANGMRFATNSTLEDIAMDGSTLNHNATAAATNNNNVCIANCALEMKNADSSVTSNIETQYAPQMCVQENFDEDYDIFYKAPPQKFRSNIAHDHLNDPIQADEPIILKSIMKCNDSATSDDDTESSIHMFDNIPDSLNYYYEKERKKVHFDSPPPSSSSASSSRQDDRMFEAMTNFMKEVTTLMSNLTKVAGRLDANPIEHSYDMHVVVNELQGFQQTSEHSCESTQTLPISTCDIATEIHQPHEHDYEDIPVNRYESLVESSCERLENTIRKSMMSNERERRPFLHPFSVASDWNCRSVAEDSSLESQSQPTFSDYGSLPRRRHNRPSFSSPSSYLRQLTNMRREIVRHSRDELSHEAHLHL